MVTNNCYFYIEILNKAIHKASTHIFIQLYKKNNKIISPKTYTEFKFLSTLNYINPELRFKLNFQITNIREQTKCVAHFAMDAISPIYYEFNVLDIKNNNVSIDVYESNMSRVIIKKLKEKRKQCYLLYREYVLNAFNNFLINLSRINLQIDLDHNQNRNVIFRYK